MRSTWGAGHPFFPGEPIYPDQEGTFNVPDVYSIGGAYRATDRWLVSVQYDRVLFSQLSDEMTDINGTTEGPGHTAILMDLNYPDSNQTRFGTEYAMVSGDRVMSFRAGGAYVTPHRLTYEPSSTYYDAQLDLLYSEETDGQWHIAPGFGLAYPKFQVDAAYDISKRSQTFSLSAVYRF